MLHILVAAAVFLADRLLKNWTVANIEVGGWRDLVPGVLSLRHELNTGGAFSMMNEHTWVLTAVSVVISIVLLYLILSKHISFWEKLCLGMVLGGAVGNGIDRIMLGYVVDMLFMDFLPLFVFNLADVFIDVGAIAFAVLFLINGAKEDKKRTGTMKELQRLKNPPEDKNGEN